jgi:hypothetical protein
MRRMARTICYAVSGLLVLAAAEAGAQGYGLQVAESAEARVQDYADLTLGTALGPNIQYYGARSTFGIQKGLRAFFDLGLVDPRKGDLDLAAQGGLLVCLQVESPIDLALRGAMYGMPGDKMDVIGGNAMFLVSKEIVYEGLFVYSGLGIDLRSEELAGDPVIHTHGGSSVIAYEGHDTKHKVNPIWTLGALLPINDYVSFYTELTLTDNPFFGFGIRIR